MKFGFWRIIAGIAAPLCLLGAVLTLAGLVTLTRPLAAALWCIAAAFNASVAIGPDR